MALATGTAVAGDPARHLGWTLSSLVLGFLWLVWAARRLEVARPGRGAAARGILIVAALVRLPLLTLPPTLSDDSWRYLWDGRVAAAGANPYRLAPDDPALAPLRDDLWQRLPHREVPTVYPPLAVTVFSIAARLPTPLLALKLMLTAADLGAVALLLALARRRGTPLARTVWYAWNPLVALEVAGMAHVDVLGVAALLGTAMLLAGGRAGAAAPAAAAGILAKLAPLAAVPMWARQSGRPVRFALAALGLVAVAAAPVVVATGGLPPGLLTYGVSWEFNGPLYEPLWRAIDGLGLDRWAHRGLDRAKLWSGRHDELNLLYPWLYPQLMAKALLAGGMLWALARSLGERDPLAGSGRLLGRLLLFSATFYPWYLLWVLPWAALERRAAWLALSALVPLAYLPQHTGVPLWPWLFLAIWVPFFLLLAAPALVRRARRPGARWRPTG